VLSGAHIGVLLVLPCIWGRFQDLRYKYLVTWDTNWWIRVCKFWLQRFNPELTRPSIRTGTFDWTTTDPANAYITPEGLRITPTLTNDTTSISSAQIEHGYLLNLTTDGTCTGFGNKACAVFSNVTTGRIINPVRSARLTTKGRKSIKYGRVEVTAKLPKGDWMWPAIWMMPETDTYGEWPRSGEIDIMEARGNSPSYSIGGRDKFSSSLHWGYSPWNPSYLRPILIDFPNQVPIKPRMLTGAQRLGALFGGVIFPINSIHSELSGQRTIFSPTWTADYILCCGLASRISPSGKRVDSGASSTRIAPTTWTPGVALDAKIPPSISHSISFSIWLLVGLMDISRKFYVHVDIVIWHSVG